MTDEQLVATLPGAQSLLDWFGHWPSFHDAEVISVELNRQGSSRVCIHCFSMTDKIDERGYFIAEKHAIVSVLLEEVTSVELADFNHQNVLFSLSIHLTVEDVRLGFDSSYGLTGHLAAKKISFEFEPGVPEGSVYSRSTL